MSLVPHTSRKGISSYLTPKPKDNCKEDKPERDMEQERREGEDMNKYQDQRLKTMQGENQQHCPPDQKCPRCESLNTKFCYYNNYSLSQPRYFCKTCRRYWTQGGALRNVPVGGSCRKGKHNKTSSSSSYSSSSSSGDQNSRSQPPYNMQGTSQSIVSNTNTLTLGANLDSPTAVAPNLMESYFRLTGGSFTSPAAFHHLNNQSFTHQPLHNLVNLQPILGGSPNMGLLHGFNPVSSHASQQHQQIQQQRHVGSRDSKSNVDHPFYACEENVTHSSMPVSSSHQQQINWHQVYMRNGACDAAVHDPALWNTANAVNSTNIVNVNAGLSSLNLDEWEDLPAGCAPPP